MMKLQCSVSAVSFKPFILGLMFQLASLIIVEKF